MPTGELKHLNKILVTDKDAFRYYRENQKLRNIEHVDRQATFSKILRKFYGKVAEKMIENPNGVYLRNFGYFTNLMNPVKTIVNIKRPWTNKELYLNPHTKRRVFHPIFFPIGKDLLFKTFIMDKSFNRDLKMELKDKLRKKTKYFNHYSLLNSIYKNKRK